MGMDDDRYKITTTGDDRSDLIFFDIHGRLINGFWCVGGHLAEQKMIADIEEYLRSTQ